MPLSYYLETRNHPALHKDTHLRFKHNQYLSEAKTMDARGMTTEQWLALPREERAFWRAYDDAQGYIALFTRYDKIKENEGKK